MFVLLDNIRSAWNVGSIFRTCDGAGVGKLYLTGYTPYPPRQDISKVALGAEENVPWEYHADPLKLIKKLKRQGIKIVAVEQTDCSLDYKRFISKKGEKLCFVFGNEVEGVSPELLELADQVVEIPMYGKKRSLNVAVAVGVTLYFSCL